MDVIGEQQKSQMSETLLPPVPLSSQFWEELGRTEGRGEGTRRHGPEASGNCTWCSDKRILQR